MNGRAAGRRAGITGALARFLGVGALGLGLGLGVAAMPSAWAQAPGIDWGTDASPFANDRECDDPRFEGPGMAKVLDDANLGADASDCFDLFKRGRIVLRADAPSIAAAAGTAIDFGDDSGRWANDGECDDPRFEGAGMAAVLVEEDRLRDATDCRTLFERGAIALRGDAAPGAPAAPGQPIDFGDDSGRWANDGECDDPRFEGAGMAAVLVEEDRLRDATDCRTLFERGAIALRGDATAPSAPGQPPAAGRPDVAGIDFGDDSGRWANDGECDDPRFEGRGMAAVLVDEDRFRDATDCRLLYQDGAIDLIGETRADVAPAAPAAPVAPAGIDFGDDSSRWANDGECDDPRFEGEGMAVGTVEDDRMRDATDCSRLFAEGRIGLR